VVCASYEEPTHPENKRNQKKEKLKGKKKTKNKKQSTEYAGDLDHLHILTQISDTRKAPLSRF
jgi:hypothetical protein